MHIKILVFSLLFIGLIYSQTTPYIKFQITEDSDYLVAYDPQTYLFIGNNNDTLWVTQVNLVNIPNPYLNRPMIELQTNKRLEMGISYEVRFRRKFNELFYQTEPMLFYGFCPPCIDTITTEPPEKIN